MNNEIITKAFNVIQNRRLKAEQEYNDKIKPLQEDKNYRMTQKEYNHLIIENARKEAYGEKPDKEKEENLKKFLNQLENKYNLQNISIEYHCKKCKDEGYINGNMCVCLKQEISNILLKESGFNKLEDFETSIKTCGEQLIPVYSLMHAWCKSDFKKNLIYMSGPTGVGKTHLIQCMANELIGCGKIIKITSALSMFLDYRDYSKTMDNSIMNKYISPEILFIDDLGTEPLYKNVTLEYLYLVINERKLRKLPTIITSNLDMDDIRNRYDERITSRIADRETSITIYLDGEDKRLKNKK